MPKDNPIDIAYVDPDSLRENPWNTNVVDPDNEQKIENSMERHGFFKPVLVRETGDRLKILEIVGGEHRWRIAKKRGEPVPIINLGPISDEEAQEIGLIDNGRYGEDDPVRLAALLEDLNLESVADVLPMSDAELDDIFTTASIASDLDLEDDEPTFDDKDAADDEPEPSSPAPKTHQLMRFKVPVEDAERVEAVLARVMKDNDFVHADSLTNAGDALVHLIGRLEDENGAE